MILKTVGIATIFATVAFTMFLIAAIPENVVQTADMQTTGSVAVK